MYDTDNNLESHLTGGKLVLEPTIEGPAIHLEVDGSEAKIGIGNSAPSEPLVVGSDLGFYSGNVIVVGNSNPGSFSAMTVGEDSNNRFYMAWDNTGDYLYAGTRVGGTFYSNTLVLRDGQVVIGTNTPSEELHVVGDICYTGSIGACSDLRYKTGEGRIENALDKVSRLRGVSFNWKKDQYPEHKFTDKEQVGLIAQEVMEIVPQVVSEDDSGYYNVDYGKLTPLLIEAIKEQQAQIEKLTKRIEELEKLNTSGK